MKNCVILLHLIIAVNSVASGITCPVLEHPTNGRVALSPNMNDTEYGTTAIFTCDIGFGLSGGEKMLTCGAGGDGASTAVGDWNSDIPTCGGLSVYINKH